MAQLDLPSNTVGTPHAVFDSTGLVYAVTAEMAGGLGNVRITREQFLNELQSMLILVMEWIRRVLTDFLRLRF
jgi:hypothetical protein